MKFNEMSELPERVLQVVVSRACEYCGSETIYRSIYGKAACSTECLDNLEKRRK
jgi:hypothetical protein